MTDDPFKQNVKPGTPKDAERMLGKKKKPRNDDPFADFEETSVPMADWERELRASTRKKAALDRKNARRKAQTTRDNSAPKRIVGSAEIKPKTAPVVKWERKYFDK